MLSPKGLTMAPYKVQIIQDWPEPQKVKDVQSFLGFANFYHHFIYGYSEITVPLTRLTHKGTTWHFSNECHSAFEALKNAFTTALVLTHWIPATQITVKTDASNYPLTAVISITTLNGEFHPIAFHSQTFSTLELNHDVHNKELLAIFEAFKRWRHYLEGSGLPIDVVTDHRNLQYFSTTKILTRRQARWSEYLSAFNPIIRFRPGKPGTKPDALTRRWDVYLKEGNSNYATVNPQNYRPVFTSKQLASSLRATTLTIPALRGSLIMDAERLHSDIWSQLREDPTSEEHLNNQSDPSWTLDPDGLLRHLRSIYVPNSGNLRLCVLLYSHDNPLAGHFGQTKTLHQVRMHYYWSGLLSYVKDYCKSCITCSRAKPVCHKPYGLLKQLLIPEKPWNSISMDFIEKLPSSSGYTLILVIVDHLSKQSLFIPTHDTIMSPQLAQLFILHVFSKHGVPRHITSDRGTEFMSHFFRSLGTALDMKLHFTSGYHPEGDGQTKRTNQTLEQYLRVYCNYQQDNWSELLPLAEFTYNNTPSATTSITPFFANKGYHLNLTVHPEHDLASTCTHDFVTDLDELHQELRQHIAEAQHQYQAPADSRQLPAPEFKIGSHTYVKAQFFCMT